jgi:hypothetical protein
MGENHVDPIQAVNGCVDNLGPKDDSVGLDNLPPKEDPLPLGPKAGNVGVTKAVPVGARKRIIDDLIDVTHPVDLDNIVKASSNTLSSVGVMSYLSYAASLGTSSRVVQGDVNFRFVNVEANNLGVDVVLSNESV